MAPPIKREFFDVFGAGDPHHILWSRPKDCVRARTRPLPALRAVTFSNGAYAALDFEDTLSAEAASLHLPIVRWVSVIPRRLELGMPLGG